jgi:hypothetical protein
MVCRRLSFVGVIDNHILPYYEEKRVERTKAKKFMSGEMIGRERTATGTLLWIKTVKRGRGIKNFYRLRTIISQKGIAGKQNIR